MSDCKATHNGRNDSFVRVSGFIMVVSVVSVALVEVMVFDTLSFKGYIVRYVVVFRTGSWDCGSANGLGLASQDGILGCLLPPGSGHFIGRSEHML